MIRESTPAGEERTDDGTDAPAGEPVGLRLLGWVRGLPQRPRIIAHRLMWEASRPLSVTLAVMVIVGSVIAPAYALVTGALIGAVATGGDVAFVLVLIGGLYAFQQVLSPAR